ncbi:N-acetyltransferase [Dysgonomonas sp. 521]|uniref:GNAT family N-acetyltransferase n=1 Tax=Dysgonomonas sp. 521 TaxID=2302932 RepID=UPI0013D595CB|nr:GNAT family N-acetyltransferase [Dysgonomonas sp. 521]NDV95563.1 N-acetyltransferase [Dysgonomonas sp. 521]
MNFIKVRDYWTNSIPQWDNYTKEDAEAVFRITGSISVLDYIMAPEADIWKIRYAGFDFRLSVDSIYGCEIELFAEEALPKGMELIKLLIANSFRKVTGIDEGWYRPIHEIYKGSFPLHEQRSGEQQRNAFENEHYRLIAKIVFTDKFNLASFISYWDFDSYVYIEHFAVNPLMRGQNVGSSSLKLFADLIKKPVLLEIDPLIDEISNKRFHFYERLGYQLNSYTHYHPAYNTQFPPHQLLVLSYPDKINQKQYDRFKSDLEHIVMNKESSK